LRCFPDELMERQIVLQKSGEILPLPGLLHLIQVEFELLKLLGTQSAAGQRSGQRFQFESHHKQEFDVLHSEFCHKGSAVFCDESPMLECLKSLAKSTLTDTKLRGHFGLNNPLAGLQLTLENCFKYPLGNTRGKVAPFSHGNHSASIFVKRASKVKYVLRTLPALPAGHYDVQIQAAGFQEYRQTGLVLDVNTALRFDATLKVGGLNQEVEVSATAVHVETSNTQMGEVIGTTKMTGLPLNGRSYTDLLALQSGVAPASSGESGAISVSGDLNPGGQSVTGQRESANGFMINGGSAEEKLYMAAGIIPNLDSIAEFRILAIDADAEYGNYSGGLVNAITKSGTNQVHGSGFDFLRNPHLDARNFYSPARAILHQNQFGGTIGDIPPRASRSHRGEPSRQADDGLSNQVTSVDLGDPGPGKLSGEVK